MSTTPQQPETHTATMDKTETPPPTTAPTATATVKIYDHTKNKGSLAPFNPTCDQALSTALKMLQLTSKDVLFDLGCGDARMLLYAAQQIPGLKCVGIELDPVFVQRGQEALEKLPETVQTRVDIRQGDLMQLMDEYTNHNRKEDPHNNNIMENAGMENENNDINSGNSSSSMLGRDCKNLSLFEDATAIYMFLLPKGIQKIQGLLNALVDKRKQEKRSLHVSAYMFSIREWEPVMVDKTTKGEAPLYLYQFLSEK